VGIMHFTCCKITVIGNQVGIADVGQVLINDWLWVSVLQDLGSKISILGSISFEEDSWVPTF